MRRYRCAFALAALLSTAHPALANDSDRAAWHLDFDAAYGRTVVQFVGAGSVVPSCGCSETPFARRTVHATMGVGHGVVTLEGSILLLVDEHDFTFIPWSIGVRIDSSHSAPIALQVRLAYLDRWGDLPGNGARAGLGIALRPFRWLAAYADALVDVTSVPQEMGDHGTLFSYATLLEAGARVSFFGP